MNYMEHTLINPTSAGILVHKYMTREYIQSENSDDNYKPSQRVCCVATVRGDCHLFGHLVSHSTVIGGIP